MDFYGFEQINFSFEGHDAILVKPIKDKTSLFNRSKRALEKPILRRYMRLHSGDSK